MAQRLVLHIGVQKSGTTYLQRMMQDRARKFAEIGVLYPLPGRRRRRRDRVNHHELATYALLGDEYPWVGAERAAQEEGWWKNLQKQVREWPGIAIVSAEALSVVRLDAARHIIDALCIADNVDIVITGRGLGRLLPSFWQQLIRNGNARGFDSFLGQLAREREAGWSNIEDDRASHQWRALALGRLVQRWASIAGMERVTFIANPGSPADLLWRRFIKAIDVGDTSNIPTPDATTTVHGGVTAAEAEVLRAMNDNLLSAGWQRADVRRLSNRVVHAFDEREERGPRLAIPANRRDQVGRWNDENIAELRQSGVRVVGDLIELSYSAEREPPEPTKSEVAEAAGVAVPIASGWTGGSTSTSRRGPRMERFALGKARLTSYEGAHAARLLRVRRR
jgi:hypothetical protein